MITEHGPHRRYNPLLREWVLVSPQRMGRPWLGRTEAPAVTKRPTYDPQCYLCPGNLRAGSTRNPQYTATFVFDNDFPALLPGEGTIDPSTPPVSPAAGLFVARAERGVCRVVCYSPRHDQDLSSLPAGDVRRVIDTWAGQFIALGAIPWVSHVQIFENRGEGMGASNPHPHGQIWANATVPDVPAREQAALADYRVSNGTCLLCDCVSREEALGIRTVCANEGFTAVVPFWAVWPFEVLVVARRHATGLDELDERERNDLADVLRRVTRRYDGLFSAPCPYSMGVHQRPTDGRPHDESHLHVHFFPPVLRSAAVHKFMVGYELLAGPQRDLTAEAAAARLRAAPDEEGIIS